jgi:di/tricarboxylate transporter
LVNGQSPGRLWDKEQWHVPQYVDIKQVGFFVILVTTFGLLITERLRNDLVAILAVLALAISGILSPSEALSGFGSGPAIIVVSIFIISSAFNQTGLSETIGAWIGRLAGRSYARILVVMMLSVAFLSAFTHHVTTTAVMLPVTLSLCQERGVAASKLLIPLSFAASLGTTMLVIGAPAFLIASDVLQRSGHSGLGIFSIAPIGLSLLLAGTLFMLLIGRFLLPEHRGVEDSGNLYRLDNYFTEVKILSDSPFLGKTLAELKATDHYHFTAAGWVRDGKRLRGPFGERVLREGDVLWVHATPEDMIAFRRERGIELQPVAKYGYGTGRSEASSEQTSEQLVQAVVAPASDVTGHTLREMDFRRRYGSIVVGLWRRGGFLWQELAGTKLEPGDVLVLQGDEESLSRIASDGAFLMMPFHGEVRLRRKARLAGAIMLATIAAAALRILSLDITVLCGAVAMVLSGCITFPQAYRAIDARIYVFIAGAVPLGAAMQKSGAAALLAGWLEKSVGGWNPTLLLLFIFVIVAVVTQFLSDAATTALFAPIALELAQALGRAPEPYVVTVAMAAVASFLTPIGHHGNLLVYGPGRYRFADFLRVGTPLTIIIALLVAWVSRIIWHG